MEKSLLDSLFDYRDGRLFHKKRPESNAYDVRFNRAYAGKEIGTKHHTGYLVHSINGKQYGVHRLVFCLHKGFMPKSIDHLNQNKIDNRIENLVETTPVKNGRNRRLGSNNSTGVIGVVFDKRRSKFKAQIKVNGKQISIGYYPDIETAAKARREAEAKYGFSSRHGS